MRGFVKARKEGGLGREVGPAAINRDLSRLSNLWNSARKRKLVTGENPVALFGRLQEPDPRVRYLAPEEEKALLVELSLDLRPIVEFAMHTGMRRGAIFGLRWADVDWQAGTLRVPSDLSKSRKPYHVAVNGRVRELLEERRLHSDHRAPEDLVFCKRDGSARRCIRNAFQAACERAGIRDLRFHDLRHDCASKIVMAGGSLYDAATHLGHRTLAVTQRYAHLSPDHLRRVADLTLRSTDSVKPLSSEPSRVA